MTRRSLSLVEIATVLFANAAFVAFSCSVLVWAQWRTAAGPRFPGPQPVGPVFKIWLTVIWVVGLILPLAALALEWSEPTRLSLVPYLTTFVLQVATELFIWKRWRSPIWVLVPCLYLPWRVFQAWWGWTSIEAKALPLTSFTLIALLVLWLINIGVHYTNIVNTLRWADHPHDASFPALRDPRVFVKDAQ